MLLFTGVQSEALLPVSTEISHEPHPQGGSCSGACCSLPTLRQRDRGERGKLGGMNSKMEREKGWEMKEKAEKELERCRYAKPCSHY